MCLGGFWYYILIAKPPQSKRTVTTQRYFLDLGNGELFAADPFEPAMVPPAVSPSGGVAVEAFVFACETCTDENRFVGYVMKWNEETYPKKVEEYEKIARGEEVIGITAGQLISLADGADWQGRDTDGSKAVMTQAKFDGHGKCSGKKVVPCYPPQPKPE